MYIALRMKHGKERKWPQNLDPMSLSSARTPSRYIEVSATP